MGHGPGSRSALRSGTSPVAGGGIGTRWGRPTRGMPALRCGWRVDAGREPLGRGLMAPLGGSELGGDRALEGGMGLLSRCEEDSHSWQRLRNDAGECYRRCETCSMLDWGWGAEVPA